MIGRKLNVATLLEGSVRKAGNRVRIGVQLVKMSDGYQLWSETYDRTLDDIFAVQDEIAQAVVKELRTTLMGGTPDTDATSQVRAEVAAAAQGRGSNSEAHRLYLQARFLLDRLNQSETERAIGHLREALRLDPTYALAWVCLAQAHANQHESDPLHIGQRYADPSGGDGTGVLDRVKAVGACVKHRFP